MATISAQAPFASARGTFGITKQHWCSISMEVGHWFLNTPGPQPSERVETTPKQKYFIGESCSSSLSWMEELIYPALWVRQWVHGSGGPVRYSNSSIRPRLEYNTEDANRDLCRRVVAQRPFLNPLGIRFPMHSGIPVRVTRSYK